MTMDIVATNMTHASNNYMECVMAAAVMTLEHADTSAATALAKATALALAFGTALFF
jgi:hypothetical protein